VSFGHPGFSGPPVHCVAVGVKSDEVERKVARQPVLGRHIQHSSHFTQHGLAIVLMLVAFNGHYPICLVNEEVYPCELLRSLTAKRDHGFTVRRVADGCEELVQPFLSLFPPLVSSFSVVPLDMSLQIVGLDIAGLTALHGTHMRTVVVVEHSMVFHVPPLFEVRSTVRDRALVRPFARVNPLVLSGIARQQLFATLIEPAEHLPIFQSLPLRSPGFANRGWWRRAGSL
jgi:hypothetical protein